MDKCREIIEMAEKGDMEAQYELGFMYYDGDGVKTDRKLALKWFTAAAMQGHKDARHQLGEMYYYGKGTKTDRVKAAQWYRMAGDYQSVSEANIIEIWQEG